MWKVRESVGNGRRSYKQRLPKLPPNPVGAVCNRTASAQMETAHTKGGSEKTGRRENEKTRERGARRRDGFALQRSDMSIDGRHGKTLHSSGVPCGKDPKASGTDGAVTNSAYQREERESGKTGKRENGKTRERGGGMDLRSRGAICL